jgi:hypothetical protein
LPVTRFEVLRKLDDVAFPVTPLPTALLREEKAWAIDVTAADVVATGVVPVAVATDQTVVDVLPVIKTDEPP